MSSPFAGALMITFRAPASIWALALSASVKRPVDSTRSLTATTSTSGVRSMTALSDWRPIRPKPLMPTRTAMTRPPGRGASWAAPPFVRATAPRPYAEQWSVVAERRLDDPHPGAGGPEGDPGDLTPGGLEQPVALCDAEAPADHDQLRVEDIDEPDHRHCERAAGQ